MVALRPFTTHLEAPGARGAIPPEIERRWSDGSAARDVPTRTGRGAAAANRPQSRRDVIIPPGAERSFLIATSLLVGWFLVIPSTGIAVLAGLSVFSFLARHPHHLLFLAAGKCGAPHVRVGDSSRFLGGESTIPVPPSPTIAITAVAV